MSWNSHYRHPMKRDFFSLQAAADYLKLSPQEVLDKMPYHTHRGVRTPDDLVYLDYSLSFAWKDVYQLRAELDQELAEKRDKPKQLCLANDSSGSKLKDSKNTTKALDQKTFDIPSAAKFLNITEPQLLFLCRSRKANSIETESDREFVYKHTLFTWEEVLKFRKVLEKQGKATPRKPQQLLFNEPL